MRSGADSEMTSGLAGPEVDIIKQAPGILQRRRSTPLASAELYVIIDLQRSADRHAGQRAAARHRAGRAAVRHEVEDRRGPHAHFGTNEVIVGARRSRPVRAARASATRSTSGQNSWQVVGIFEAGRHRRGNRNLVRRRASLQGAYRRGNSIQSVLAQLDSPTSFDIVQATG